MGIARQILFSILLISSLFTLFTTCLNLYIDYKQDLAAIEERFVQIEESYLSSLVSSFLKTGPSFDMTSIFSGSLSISTAQQG